ncbi:MAG: hypothetical protein RLZZ65_1427 [Bacteroidota bacterium]|jgi:hypothetical protein
MQKISRKNQKEQKADVGYSYALNAEDLKKKNKRKESKKPLITFQTKHFHRTDSMPGDQSHFED